MNPIKLWFLIKSTLIEKDNTNPVYGSIKRWLAWILAGLVILVVIAGLIPGGSLHIGTFLNFSWNHNPTDTNTLSILLKAIGMYVLGGATVSMLNNTITNYHNQKYGNDTTPTNEPPTP